MLHPQKPVFNIGISNPFRKNDDCPRQAMGIGRIPTRYVPGGLHPAPGILLRRRRAQECGGSSSQGSVDNVADAPTQIIVDAVEGIVGRIPSSIEEPFVKRAFVRQPKAAAERDAAVAEDIPGKPILGPKLLWSPAPNLEAGAKPPGPHAPASTARGFPGHGALASLIWPAPVVMLSIRFLPGPFRKVVAR